MVWPHKILKLIFQKQSLCPRNKCTDHWRKLPNLTAFLEIFLNLKNNNSVERGGQPNAYDCIQGGKGGLILAIFEGTYYVDDPLGQNSRNFYGFLNKKSVFLQILYHSSVTWDIIPLYFFSQNFT